MSREYERIGGSSRGGGGIITTEVKPFAIKK
jgi:hypothetical protein